ncbi:MAG: hypothetical protein ACLR2D_06650 [Anaerobutyricum hallii]
MANDAFNWNTTLKQAMEKTGNKASFVLSSGTRSRVHKESLNGAAWEVKSNTVWIFKPGCIKESSGKALVVSMMIMQKLIIILIQQMPVNLVQMER